MIHQLTQFKKHFSVHLQETCVHSRQCIDKHSFCGIVELTPNLTTTICICEEGTKEVCGECVVWHQCNINHFNRDYLQADCPHGAMYCTANRCLCRPGFIYSSQADDCVVEEEDEEDEEEEVSTIGKEVEARKQTFERSDIKCSNKHASVRQYLNHQVPQSVAILIICSLFIGVFVLGYIFLNILWSSKYSKVASLPTADKA